MLIPQPNTPQTTIDPAAAASSAPNGDDLRTELNTRAPSTKKLCKPWAILKYAGPSERDMCMVRVIVEFNSQRKMRAEAKTDLKFEEYRELWVRPTMARECPKVQP
jgi:hypothetical protein